MQFKYTERNVSIVLAMSAFVTSIFCFSEFAVNAKDIFYHLLSWRSAVQWIPQTLVLGMTFYGAYVIYRKQRDFHFKVSRLYEKYCYCYMR